MVSLGQIWSKIELGVFKPVTFRVKLQKTGDQIALTQKSEMILLYNLSKFFESGIVIDEKIVLDTLLNQLDLFEWLD